MSARFAWGSVILFRATRTPSPRVRGEGRGEGDSRLGWALGLILATPSLCPQSSESLRRPLTLGRFAPSTSPRAAGRGDARKHYRFRDAHASELCLPPRTKVD